MAKKLLDMDTKILGGREVIIIEKDQALNVQTGEVHDYSGLRAKDQDDSQDLVNTSMAEILLSADNQMFKDSKKDFIETTFSRSGNIKYIRGREHGVSYITREQMNMEKVRNDCKKAREWHLKLMNQGLNNSEINPTCELPTVVRDNILKTYFDNRRFSSLEDIEEGHFYHVVNTSYPDYVIHGSGKIKQAIPFAYNREYLCR